MTTIAVIGLGYVGLPLAVEFGKKFRTLGFDLSAEKIAAYARFVDPTGEVSEENLRAATKLTCSTDPAVIAEADFIVVAVPTPVGDAHQPDFTPLIKSSESVGKHLKRGAIVVFESTVYPGATEEVCIPVIEKHSGGSWKLRPGIRVTRSPAAKPGSVDAPSTRTAPPSSRSLSRRSEALKSACVTSRALARSSPGSPPLAAARASSAMAPTSLAAPPNDGGVCLIPAWTWVCLVLGS